MRRLDYLFVAERPNRTLEATPLLRHTRAQPSAKHPVDLTVSAEEDAKQDEFRHSGRAGLSIGKSKCTAPRSPKDQPTVDSEVCPKPLEVCDEVGGGVPAQVADRDTGVRRASSAIPLMKEHDAVARRVEQTSVSRSAGCARASVQNDRGLSLRVSTRLPVDRVPVTDIEPSLLVRFDVWIEVH
jgi:hypothetical protein